MKAGLERWGEKQEKGGNRSPTKEKASCREGNGGENMLMGFDKEKARRCSGAHMHGGDTGKRRNEEVGGRSE
jgi:hypothetical protein